jgi:hypothetical protein
MGDGEDLRAVHPLSIATPSESMDLFVNKVNGLPALTVAKSYQLPFHWGCIR